MIAALLLACGGGSALPEVPKADPVAATWIVGVTADGFWLEGPDHPRAPLADPGGDDPAIPALIEALKPVVQAGVTPAVAADADVPYRKVLRVLVSFGLAPTNDALARVRTPAGEGELRIPFPRFCGGTDALLAAAEGPSKCVAPIVREVDGGLRVDLLSVEQDKPGCLVLVPERGAPTGWQGAVALPGAGACPSVAGRDPAALGALLDRARAYGPACGSASVSFRDETPWGDAVKLWATVRERHSAAGLAVGSADPGCDRGVALP